MSLFSLVNAIESLMTKPSARYFAIIASGVLVSCGGDEGGTSSSQDPPNPELAHVITVLHSEG